MEQNTYKFIVHNYVDTLETEAGLVIAENYTDAMKKISLYFGDEIERVIINQINNSDLICYNKKIDKVGYNLVNKLAKHTEKNWIW